MIHEQYEELTDKKLTELEADINSWKEKYGDINIISIELDDGEEFQGIFRLPTERDIKLAMRKELSNMESNRELIRITVLYPEVTIFSQILKKYWGIATPIANRLIELCHVSKEAKIKKL
ncbi:MAG: hypothetical protein FWH53_00095 [Leptospirales bacterium]|nr:hypothetical protein [Leptospirales bacterium]